jgi:16S rRNA (guanine1207-N2)-methyltransferase
MAFWSARDGDRPRRRHAITFHAKIGDGPSMSFESWPGTFGYGRMDNGSRAMLEVADVNEGDHILDMGCGNGTVGCLASPRAGPTGQVTFVDSNVRAIALTDLNARANGVPNYRLVTTAKLEGLAPDSFDVALANPPYYADSEVARLFISSARDLLKPGGRFYLVTKMPVQTIPEVVETFGEVESVENRGYTVLIARV